MAGKPKVWTPKEIRGLLPPVPEGSTSYCPDCGYPLIPPCQVCARTKKANEDMHSEWRAMVGGDRAWYEYTKEKHVETQFNAAARRAALKFKPLSGNIIFTGPKGTGKSHLAAIIKRQHVLTGGKCLTIFMQEELRGAKADFKKTHVVDDRILPMVNAQVLSLEDVGVEKPSAWVVNEWYYPIIDGRYRAARKGLILTINMTLDELEAFWAPFEPPSGRGRIVSRLHEMCKGNVFSLAGERDWRKG